MDFREAKGKLVTWTIWHPVTYALNTLASLSFIWMLCFWKWALKSGLAIVSSQSENGEYLSKNERVGLCLPSSPFSWIINMILFPQTSISLSYWAFAKHFAVTSPSPLLSLLPDIQLRADFASSLIFSNQRINFYHMISLADQSVVRVYFEWQHFQIWTHFKNSDLYKLVGVARVRK